MSLPAAELDPLRGLRVLRAFLSDMVAVDATRATKAEVGVLWYLSSGEAAAFVVGAPRVNVQTEMGSGEGVPGAATAGSDEADAAWEQSQAGPGGLELDGRHGKRIGLDQRRQRLTAAEGS